MTIGPSNSVDFISIKIWSQDNVTMLLKIIKTIRIEKIMKSYCRRRNIPLTSVLFLYGGRVIGEDATALSLNMEDGDVIAVLNKN